MSSAQCVVAENTNVILNKVHELDLFLFCLFKATSILPRLDFSISSISFRGFCLVHVFFQLVLCSEHCIPRWSNAFLYLNCWNDEEPSWRCTNDKVRQGWKKSWWDWLTLGLVWIVNSSDLCWPYKTSRYSGQLCHFFLYSGFVTERLHSYSDRLLSSPSQMWHK